MKATNKIVRAGDWRPRKWSEVAGNYEIVQYWSDMIRAVRFGGVSCGFNGVLIGDSGSGKTALTELGMQAIGCLFLNHETLDPCGKCENCRQDYSLFGHVGWETHVDWLDESENPTNFRYHYISVDCPRLQAAEFEKILNDLPSDDNMRKFIFLDEVHCLSRLGMDEKLLKAIELHPVIWIAASAVIEDEQKGRQKLEQMLINRFTYVLPTEKPNTEDFMRWCVDRCEDFGLTVEEPATTLQLLAGRTEMVIRDVLHILQKAQNSREKVLTLKMVKSCKYLK